MQKLPEPSHFEALYPPSTREKELSQLAEMVKKGVSCEIVGLPGVGRGALCRLFAYNKAVRSLHFKENERWMHFVVMDCSEVKGRTLADFTKFILLSLAYSLEERKFTEEQNTINKLVKDSSSEQDDLILFQTLKKAVDYLAIEREFTLVFMFDRFEEYIPTLTPQFFSNLKTLRDRAKYRFTSVFSLSRPLEDVLEPTIFGSFYEFILGNALFVSLFDPVGTDFRIQYLEKITGKKISEDIKKSLLTLTGGHGKVTKLALETAISNPDEKSLKETLLSKTSIQGALYEIWASLLPDEQKSLHKYSSSTTSHRHSGEQSDARIKSWSSQDDNNDYLSKVNLIKDNKITIPLLEEFIATLPSQKDTIIYDEGKKEILKNNESITELFSPSEFRLLKFLLENKDRICDKDEIIQAVWSDSAATAGVTDQALDQIIYRLRKKIEPDPNNPVYLQTIKGRGYKFTS